MTTGPPGDPWDDARDRVRGEVRSALAPGARTCRHCGTESVTAARLCPRCGMELGEGRRPPSRRAPALFGAAALLAMIAAGGVVFAIGAGRTDDALDAAERARERAAREAALERESSPQFGSIAPPEAGLPDELVRASRRALVGRLADHIQEFARANPREGAPRDPSPLVSCEPYPRSRATRDGRVDLEVRATGYQCLAARDHTPGVAIGQPFLARVDFRRFSYAFCRVHPPPGEHGRAAALPEVPEACTPP